MHVEFNELRAHALHLLFHRRPRVEGADDGAHAARRANRRESGHAGADHQHLGGRHAPGRGHLAREETPVEAGRFDHGAVAGDVGHRRQRIHLLRARDAWNLVHRDRGCLARRQPFDDVRVLARIQETNERAALADQFGLVHPHRRMRGGWLHLQDDVAGLPDLARAGNDLGAGGRIVVVAERRRGAGVVFDRDAEAQFDEFGDVFRGDCDPAFSGAAFFRDGELHLCGDSNRRSSNRRPRDKESGALIPGLLIFLSPVISWSATPASAGTPAGAIPGSVPSGASSRPPSATKSR